jgi:hypothetical protein
MRRKHGDPFIGRLERKVGNVPLTEAVFYAAVGLSVALRPALATTEIQGQADDLLVRVENASISEVLDELSAQFNLSYNRSSNLNHVLTGNYSGSLQQVLARVLVGYDYVVTNSDEAVRVVIVNAMSAATPTAATLASSEANGVQQPPTPSTAAKPVPPLSSYLR